MSKGFQWLIDWLIDCWKKILLNPGTVGWLIDWLDGSTCFFEILTLLRHSKKQSLPKFAKIAILATLTKKINREMVKTTKTAIRHYYFLLHKQTFTWKNKTHLPFWWRPPHLLALVALFSSWEWSWERPRGVKKWGESFGKAPVRVGFSWILKSLLQLPRCL